ncbi:MAG: hypothetical protein BWX47_01874 [candidate division Hyd24-12 bacterium ADurb.Bin004]|nr:MAG: hypothetical protein BWX47_01874 [candidate division Hyd24-12 bacterium ADurb.Bin004]
MSWLKISICGKTSLGNRSMPSWVSPKMPTPVMKAKSIRNVTLFLTEISEMFKTETSRGLTSG